MYIHTSFIQHNTSAHHNLLTSQDIVTSNPVTSSGVSKLEGIRLCTGGGSWQINHIIMIIVSMYAYVSVYL